MGLLLGLAGTYAPDASACSPLPPPTLPEPCVNVRVYVPGDIFPLSLADTDIRVWIESYDGFGHSRLPDDSTLTVVVARATDTGFEIVPHTLDGVQVLITDPVPGMYAIASAAQTCEGEPASFTEGSVRAAFELTEEVPLPDRLGGVTWLGQTVGPEVVSIGQDSECRDVTRVDRIAHNRFELTLSSAAEPWIYALRFGIEIDGEIVYGFGIHEFSRPWTVAFDHAVVCPADDVISPGAHTLRFLGSVDSTVIPSAPVDFEFDCGVTPEGTGAVDAGADAGTVDAGVDAGAGAPGSPGHGPASASGCSMRTTPTAGGSGPLALLAIFLLGASRPRSRRRRASAATPPTK